MTKILLIDDDPDVRTLMSKVLNTKGYAVETASKKEEAFALLAAGEPAVILMDVLLSGEDGREICRQLKDDAATRHIPVIMFSGHPGAAQNFQSWGAADFIAKPIDMAALLQKVKEQTSQV